jgi:hypothetical protein
LNQAFCDLSPLPIELVRSVRCLAKQDEARITYELEQRIIVGASSCERMSGIANEVRNDGKSRVEHNGIPILDIPTATQEPNGT